MSLFSRGVQSGPSIRVQRRNPLWGKSVWQLYVLILLPVAFIFIFNYLPMGGVLVAFKDYSIRRGIWGSQWAGLKYFRQFFETPIFFTILKNTVALSLLSLAVGFPFPILLALGFNEITGLKVKKTIQTLVFAPYFVSTVVVVSILFQIFSYRYGLVNSALNLMGFKSLDFLGMDRFFRPAYVWSGVWQGAGYGSILYLAALSGIDVNLYDAAAIDGANKFQRLRHIDLPGIAPTIIIMLILNAGSVLSVGFEKVYLMQNPVNYTISEVISTYVYKVGIQQAQFSFSTAVGLFNSTVNCVILLLVNWIAGKVNETNLF
ncbi:MAG: ABC transporter permease subunit [Treponema sp.]|nr:ABC transporter permease subunit [Treponema sp.]